MICQATSRIRKDVVSLAAQATELHSTFNSARALGISGGGGGGGKSVAEIVDMAKEIQALTKKVEKLKTQKKAQVANTSLLFLFFFTLFFSLRAPAFLTLPLLLSAGPEGCGAAGVGGVGAHAAQYA